MVLVAMFNAAFDMRYEYHPPNPLSEIEPTRALTFTTTADGTFAFLRGSTRVMIGARAAANMSGPIALIDIDVSAHVLSTALSDLSGPGSSTPPSMPATFKRTSTRPNFDDTKSAVSSTDNW
eukprot:CAMPEP_0113322526 /NCGR_PEP_ID=MMETSP0010_2-20120614/15668_1 /TAXON_ID=216773 ORGANISM="Corethron hystrix, Strain 308" /NCGR_SAMPLE_ID=MMETSP0010_2 /ASSEMBLY_ACC=CAM_ASM_000155 /LENGTH=121 /DNA_ID=CAMNT_0000181063 /DNA_START=176 /DNA_END=538 /DNA_ORIENTATION=- /assembly_acc=CAM_ASM_000155